MNIWKLRKQQCPNRCEGYLKLENVHRIIRNMVDEVIIKCKYQQHGCDIQYKVGDLKAHSDACLFYPLCCPNQGCDFIAARHLMHDHTVSCEYKTEVCDKGCQKVLK